MKLAALFLVFLTASASAQETDTSDDAGSGFKIEGKLVTPEPKPLDWHWNTRILVDGGRKSAFIKEDHSFVIHGLPSGSYLIEVTNPDFYYEPVRVDITSKGKMRARKVNNLQPSQVNQVSSTIRLFFSNN